MRERSSLNFIYVERQLAPAMIGQNPLRHALHTSKRMRSKSPERAREIHGTFYERNNKTCTREKCEKLSPVTRAPLVLFSCS